MGRPTLPFMGGAKGTGEDAEGTQAIWDSHLPSWLTSRSAARPAMLQMLTLIIF